MARELMLLVATAIVCLAPGIHGQDHLSFAADQQVKEVSRQGCGSTRLCVETPDDCDPTHPDCLFSSVVHNTGNNPASFDVTLSGMSTGYIAMGLVRTPNDNAKPAAVFVCAQDNEKNGEFFFFSMLGDSEGNLTPLKQQVNEIRGTVHANNMITCEFSIPQDKVDNVDGQNVDKSDALLHVLLGTGPTTGKLLGVMKVQLTSSKLDLTDPKA